jgi:photosystem II stability/assembly factor-like uncharacterized protein
VATSRRRTSAVAALLVCAASVVGLPATAAPAPVAQPCTEFAASPAFAADHTAFCTGEQRDASTGTTTGVAFFVTTDGGKSWAKATAVGLVTPAGADVLQDLFVSPRYADDEAVFVQLTNGLFVSVDRGATFLPADPLAWGRLTPFVAGAAPAGAVAHTLIAHARRGDTEGANQSSILDPTTRARTPAKGSPGFDTEFAISPGFAKDGMAFVMAAHGAGLTRQFRLYGCSVALECSTPLFAFPKRWTFDRLWLAPDFSTSKTLYVSIRPLEGPMTLWWSHDAGKTFVRWTAAERLQRDFTSVAFGLSGVAGTRQLYFRITRNAGDKPTSPPFEQLFWSRDDGATWTRVAYGRAAYQPGPRGTMPPAPPREYDADGQTARGLVTATGSGRVFMLGQTIDGKARYESLFCTVDNGRTWARYCAR